MKTESVEVTSKGQTVETIEVGVYENEDDLASLDLATILGYVDRQSKADAANKCRAKHREKEPGKGKRYKMGLNCLMTMTFADGDAGITKLQAIATDPSLTPDQRNAKMDELVQSDEVQAEVTKLIGASA